MFDGPAGFFAPSDRPTDEAGVSWIPSTLNLVTPSGETLRYARVGRLHPPVPEEERLAEERELQQLTPGLVRGR